MFKRMSAFKVIYDSYFFWRGGAVVARRAHIPKASGSNPLPATTRWLGDIAILVSKIECAIVISYCD